MGNFSRDALYNLNLEGQESYFLAFDPSDYTEVELYAHNPVFQNQEIASLLDVANKALICFTRAAEYEAEIQERYSFLSAKEIKKNIKNKKSKFPGFNTKMFQAFRCKKSDFEEVVRFCCDLALKINQEYERTGFNDSDLLDSLLRDDVYEGAVTYKSKSGRLYKRPQILGIFALWKIDRAIISIRENFAADAIRLIADANKAVSIANHYYLSETSVLAAEKFKSEAAAKSAENTHDRYDEVKEKSVSIYKAKKWRSVKSAAEVIFDALEEHEKKIFMSSEGGIKTLSKWFSEADPSGEYSEYKKKSSRQRANSEEAKSE